MRLTSWLLRAGTSRAPFIGLMLLFFRILNFPALAVEHLDLRQPDLRPLAEPQLNPAGRLLQIGVRRRLRAHQIGVRQYYLREKEEERPWIRDS